MSLHKMDTIYAMVISIMVLSACECCVLCPLCTYHTHAIWDYVGCSLRCPPACKGRAPYLIIVASLYITTLVPMGSSLWNRIFSLWNRFFSLSSSYLWFLLGYLIFFCFIYFLKNHNSSFLLLYFYSASLRKLFLLFFIVINFHCPISLS